MGGEVIVALDGGLKVMAKEDEKWREVNTLQVCVWVRLRTDGALMEA